MKRRPGLVSGTREHCPDCGRLVAVVAVHPKDIPDPVARQWHARTALLIVGHNNFAGERCPASLRRTWGK